MGPICYLASCGQTASVFICGGKKGLFYHKFLCPRFWSVLIGDKEVAPVMYR